MPSASIATGVDGATFVDTNVLVYAHDAADQRKHRLARDALAALWHSRGGLLSTQVLQEFYAVATAPHKLQMRPAEAREIVALYSTWPVVVLEPSLILTASRLQEQRSISFWDALIVEAALIGGAERILSEDLNAGEDLAGMRVVNPFAQAEGSDGETGRVLAARRPRTSSGAR